MAFSNEESQSMAEPDRDTIKVLVVDDDEDDFIVTRDLLSDVRGVQFNVDWASSYDEGFSTVFRGIHDVALIDFHLGSETGIEFLREAMRRGCRIPLILLTGQADRETDLLAMRSGASDYLVKGQFTADMLERAIRYACERSRLIEEIRSLSLTDELTGLYNRRGFFTLCEQRLRAIERRDIPCILIFADLDGMKRVNDELGHETGDRLLVDTANVLRSTFRKSDLVARMGGDEFVIFADESGSEEAEKMIARMQSNLERWNQTSERPYIASLSAGAIPFRSSPAVDIHAIVASADERMLQQKRARRQFTRV
jgi:diguanylate cyclase (GGDEF)-like protein